MACFEYSSVLSRGRQYVQVVEISSPPIEVGDSLLDKVRSRSGAAAVYLAGRTPSTAIYGIEVKTEGGGPGSYPDGGLTSALTELQDAVHAVESGPQQVAQFIIQSETER
jgi:hypothetical protein